MKTARRPQGELSLRHGNEGERDIHSHHDDPESTGPDAVAGVERRRSDEQQRHEERSEQDRVDRNPPLRRPVDVLQM
jgi:hypothetical protein